MNNARQLAHAAGQLKPGPDALVLFFLLFSGPPKFRVREAMASLEGDIDIAATVQAIVAIAGGCWIVYQLLLMWAGKRPRLQFALPQRLALLMIVLLGVGTASSLSPALTAFKLYQATVDFVFCLMFVQWYGVDCFFRRLTTALLLICAMIGVAVFLMPDIVLDVTELGGLRLRGLGIADAGFCSALAIVLLLAGKRSRASFWSWLSLCSLILIASLTRNAWGAVGAFMFLAVWKRPELQRIKTISYLLTIAIVVPFVGGIALLNHYRDAESIFTLSDRIGLWAYMSAIVLKESPITGLGYVAGARELGLEYNSALGAGHSLFFEVFIGGGLLAASVFVLLFAVLSVYAIRLLKNGCTALEFTTGAVFVCIAIMGFVGGELDSTPFAFAFWGLTAALPLLQSRAVRVRDFPGFTSPQPASIV